MPRSVLAVALLGLSVLPASAETADEIVAKYIQKIGGADKIAAINTVRRTGKASFSGIDVTGIRENKRPNMIRQEVKIQGMNLVMAYDGHTGWKIEPFMGKKD